MLLGDKGVCAPNINPNCGGEQERDVLCIQTDRTFPRSHFRSRLWWGGGGVMQSRGMSKETDSTAAVSTLSLMQLSHTHTKGLRIFKGM